MSVCQGVKLPRCLSHSTPLNASHPAPPAPPPPVCPPPPPPPCAPQELWEVRERLAEALLCDGHTYKYVVSLPRPPPSMSLIPPPPCAPQELWEVRERLAEALLCDGHTYKYDVSLPLSSYYELVTAMRDRLAGKATRVIAYGHVGDGEGME